MVPAGLVVDDAAIMRIRLRDILEPCYQIVAEAADGEEALELYFQHRPDFITLDITMPRTDGINALQRLIQSDPNAKVIIVSAIGQKRIVLDALNMGASDFIIKPFEPDRVRLAVGRVLDHECPV
jgi:two-component system, chemotaxis family, chemotaxis protein CheY